MPGSDDLAERAGRYLDASRIPRAALRIAVEIEFAPFVEVQAREHRPFMRRHILDETIPLGLGRHDTPGRKRRERCKASWLAARDRREQDSRSISEGWAAANRPVGIDP